MGACFCCRCMRTMLAACCGLLLLLLASHSLAQTDANVSAEYGGMDFPYFVAATAYPCSDLDECTYVINGSDAMGEGDVNKNDVQLANSNPCILQGRLTVSQNWFGYLARVNLAPNAGLFYYKFTFAKERCCIKIILYLEEQVHRLRAHMNCLQRQSVVDPTSPQVITLSPSNLQAGCTNVTEAAELSTIECRSGRLLKSDRPLKWFIAASSCGSPTGLDVEYLLEIYGNADPECPVLQTESGSRMRTLFSPLLSFTTTAWIISSYTLTLTHCELFNMWHS